MSNSKEKFVNVYKEVFNQDGSIKPCGRKTTICLIELANELKPGIDFGSNETGIMNVENIKTLHSELK